MKQRQIPNRPFTVQHSPFKIDHALGPMAAILTAGLAFFLYLSTLAPGLTWAYEGADGGELLAAAVVNGVPHPPGYPLYIPILRGWLAGVGWLLPASNLAWRGNLLSAIFAALSVGVTVFTIGHFMQQLTRQKSHWAWATLAGLALAIAPLFWGQALITEVYTLHLFFVALLGWALLGAKGEPRALIPALALGVAHNATFLLLLPAGFYYLWSTQNSWQGRGRLVAIFALGGLLGLCFYARIPLVASTTPPPPVNWGYADNGSGFLWLTTAQAYRGYFLDFSLVEDGLGRLITWAYLLTQQFTPIGFGIGIIGLAYLDSIDRRFQNFLLLWIAPISLYSMGYYTRDNNIYLLPVIWVFALLIAVGLHALMRWLTRLWAQGAEEPQQRQSSILPFIALKLLGILGVALLLFGRVPSISLKTDREAERFLADAIAVVEPHSIVVSNGDKETFALWYSAWATGDLLQAAPGTLLVNYSLYPFPWYQRLLRERHPEVRAIGQPFEAFLGQNMAQHPIYTSEILPIFDEESLRPAGPLWQYQTLNRLSKHVSLSKPATNRSQFRHPQAHPQWLPTRSPH